MKLDYYKYVYLYWDGLNINNYRPTIFDSFNLNR